MQGVGYFTWILKDGWDSAFQWWGGGSEAEEEPAGGSRP